MNRREFLEILRGQLDGQMDRGKAAAHVRYYEDYIQSQVRSGRTEAEVLGELGDPRLIARTLIDTDDGTGVYDDSGYGEDSYGPDDYAGDSREPSGKSRSFRLDLSTWYGKLIVIVAAAAVVILLATVLVAVAPFLITFGIVLYLITWFRKRRA